MPGYIKLDGVKRVHHIVLIVLACAAVYANSMKVPFQWDGTYYIMENPAVRDLSYFVDISKAHGDFHQALKMRWVGILSFALDYQVAGFRPWVYHLDNIALHTANALLVYMLMVLLLRTPLLSSSALSRLRDVPALSAALLFTVHPLQTEAVTYIFQRLAALAAFFYLASTVLYIWARLAPGRKQGMALYAFSLLSTVIAMKTKENTFTLPFALLLMEMLFFPGPRKRRLARLVPFALTLLIIPLSLTGTAKPLGDIIASLGPSTRGAAAYTRAQYLLTQFPVLVRYLRLLVFPVGQNLDHFVPVETYLFSFRVMGSLAVLAVLFFAGVYCLLRSRAYETDRHLVLAAFGVFWFFITISVESSFVPIPQLMTEYRMYLPGAGLIMAAMTGAFHLARSPRARRALTAALAAAVLVLGGATIARNAVWRDGTVLWADVVSKNPKSAVGYNNLGLRLMDTGRNGPAVEQYRKALEIRPGFPDPYNNLGIALGNMGKPRQAIQLYEKAIALDPSHYRAYNNMGNAYRDLDLMAKAIASYRTAVALNPAYAEAHNNLGVALARTGNAEGAFRHFVLALQIKPEFTGAHFNLGILYLSIGNTVDARQELETVLRLSPGDEQARELLKNISTGSK